MNDSDRARFLVGFVIPALKLQVPGIDAIWDLFVVVKSIPLAVLVIAFPNFLTVAVVYLHAVPAHKNGNRTPDVV